MRNLLQTSRKGGFTLIEILVVIGIIAILAAVVLIAINPARQFKQARDSQRVSNINAILNGIGQYLADKKGELPSSLASAAVDTDLDISSSAVNICTDLVPTYMSSFPVDPGTDPDAGGALGKGEPIPSGSCATYITGYKIRKGGTDGRITVKAVGEITPNISVTR